MARRNFWHSSPPPICQSPSLRGGRVAGARLAAGGGGAPEAPVLYPAGGFEKGKEESRHNSHPAGQPVGGEFVVVEEFLRFASLCLGNLECRLSSDVAGQCDDGSRLVTECDSFSIGAAFVEA